MIVLLCLESPSPSPASRAALCLASTLGDKAEVVVLSAGGATGSASFELARQSAAVRRIVHLQDTGLREPDFFTLGMVLAEAARHLEARVVVAGQHTDIEGQGLVPAALAHHLRAPLFARVQSATLPPSGQGVLKITVRAGGKLCTVASPLPVVLSTSEGELGSMPPREAGQSAPTVETLSLAQLGMAASLLVPRPGLLGILAPAQGHGIESKSFDESARILLRGR